MALQLISMFFFLFQMKDSVMSRLASCSPASDKFENLCQIADQTLFVIVDWAKTSMFFQDLEVCF